MAVKLFRALYIILFFLCAYVLGTFLHELGHMVMGLVSGYKFISLRIGSYVLTREDRQWKIKRMSIPGTAGQCLMMPPDSDTPEKVPAVLYHMGGGLFNLLTALCAYLLFLVCQGRPLRIFLILLCTVSLALAILNLYPVKLQVPNDGYNIKRILKSKADRIAVYNVLKIHSYPDLSPGELPEKLYSWSDEGEFSGMSKLMRGYYLLDQHRFDEAEQFFRAAAEKNDKSIGYYRLEAACELLFCLLLRNAPEEEIQAVYDDELKQYIEKTKKHQIPKRRLLYAYQLLYCGNEDTAEQEYTEAMEMMKPHASKGEIKMETSLLDHVRNMRKKNITGFEKIIVRESGMRFQYEYEILNQGTQTEISQYSLYYQNGEDQRRKERSTQCDTGEVLDKLNEYEMMRWDGFHGKHPRNVKDGVMFTLTATVNDGQVIKAEGSENFPAHYREFMRWLNDKLSSEEEVNR